MLYSANGSKDKKEDYKFMSGIFFNIKKTEKKKITHKGSPTIFNFLPDLPFGYVVIDSVHTWKLKI